MAFLLRVELPDVPGSLGGLATALGAVGADIEAIEIVEHKRDGTAVDDVLLDLPVGVLPDYVVSACNRVEGVRVLWISRYAAGGNLHLDLEVVEAMTQNPTAAVGRLVEMLPATFRCDWALSARRREGRQEVLDSTPSAPDLAASGSDWFPIDKAGVLTAPVHDGEAGAGDTLVAAAPLGDAERLIAFGRHGGPEILDSELARLSHLAALAVSITAAASG